MFSWNFWVPFGIFEFHVECLGPIWNVRVPFGMFGSHLEGSMFVFHVESSGSMWNVHLRMAGSEEVLLVWWSEVWTVTEIFNQKSHLIGTVFTIFSVDVLRICWRACPFLFLVDVTAVNCDLLLAVGSCWTFLFWERLIDLDYSIITHFITNSVN